jgi:hypothetical protein
VPVSISSRRPAAFFFAAVLRFGAALRFAAIFFFGHGASTAPPGCPFAALLSPAPLSRQTHKKRLPPEATGSLDRLRPNSAGGGRESAQAARLTDNALCGLHDLGSSVGSESIQIRPWTSGFLAEGGRGGVGVTARPPSEVLFTGVSLKRQEYFLLNTCKSRDLVSRLDPQQNSFHRLEA